METPATDAGTFEPSVRTTATPSSAERLSPAAARLLERSVVPGLMRRKDRSLARTVRAAVRNGAAERLAELPERERRTLLELLESLLRSPSSQIAPRVVVELTALLGGVPEPEVRLSRWRTAPAR